jgi:hypothetical protein
MRYSALFLLLAAGSTNAASLEISVSQGNHEPEFFTYNLTDQPQTLDLRESERYTVAMKDIVRGKEICREAEFRSGMIISLRLVDKPADGQYKVEVIGQISNLKSIDEKERLSCGVNQVPVIENLAFSDTLLVEASKTKVMVVDGTTTLLLTIKD